MAETLILSCRDTPDRATILAVAAHADVGVRALDGWRVLADLRAAGGQTRLYAEPLFAEAVAGDLNLTLLDPAPDWLARVPRPLLGRRVQATTLGQSRRGRFPAFVKAADDKLGGLPGRVWLSADALPDGLDADLAVLISEPVELRCELRLFCADGDVLTGSSYLRDGEPDQRPLDVLEDGMQRDARALAAAVFDHAADGLPSHVVLDVGQTDTGALVVIEANGAWGAGLYASDAAGALACVLGASLPRPHAVGLPAEIRREPPPAVWE